MTITLDPAVEGRLREEAAARGEEPGRYANVLLAQILDAALDPAAIEGIGEGLAQLDAGEGRPLSEFHAELMAEWATRAAKA